MHRDFNPADFNGLLGEALARRLTAMGYRRVSNRYRIVARVDRPDWIPIATNSYGYFMGADHYRRCSSKDWIEGVPGMVYKHIPASNHDETGFVEEMDCPQLSNT